MGYNVTSYRDRGREVVLQRHFDGLAQATGVFQKEAARVILDLDATVLLSRVTGENTGTTLAAKSTDATSVDFHYAYYKLAYGAAFSGRQRKLPQARKG